MEGAISVDGATSEQVIGFCFHDRPVLFPRPLPPPFGCPSSLSFSSQLPLLVPTQLINISLLSPLHFSSLLGQTFALAGSVCFSLIATLVNYQ